MQIIWFFYTFCLFKSFSYFSRLSLYHMPFSTRRRLLYFWVVADVLTLFRVGGSGNIITVFLFGFQRKNKVRVFMGRESKGGNVFILHWLGKVCEICNGQEEMTICQKVCINPASIVSSIVYTPPKSLHFYSSHSPFMHEYTFDFMDPLPFTKCMEFSLIYPEEIAYFDLLSLLPLVRKQFSTTRILIFTFSSYQCSS